MAHPLSTVKAFDRVVVVVDGKVIEDGPPEKLRRSDGVFGRMWQIRRAGFEAA